MKVPSLVAATKSQERGHRELLKLFRSISLIVKFLSTHSTRLNGSMIITPNEFVIPLEVNEYCESRRFVCSKQGDFKEMPVIELIECGNAALLAAILSLNLVKASGPKIC